MKPWRKIVSRKESSNEHLSIRGRGFTWWKSFKTAVTLECGHIKIYVGFSNDGPDKKARCKECPET